MTSSNCVTIALSGSNAYAAQLSKSLSAKFQIIQLGDDSPPNPKALQPGQQRSISLLNFCDFGHNIHLRLIVKGVIEERFCDVLISSGGPDCTVKKLMGLQSEALDLDKVRRKGAIAADISPIQSYGRVIFVKESTEPKVLMNRIENVISENSSTCHIDFNFGARTIEAL